ncbi:glycosyltransferase [Echinimonas agarilytica]|uniref:Glycosyltransferase n=1 Tax=Echinimonas agarilytica TaxID=1215918 RepID=A0AA42B6D7_9GAMM|nr:glycosyltransferase [Echinimonas agarilytica]MCM2678652.1 glycosyltransferase [Echinimonas agarilytica]
MHTRQVSSTAPSALKLAVVISFSGAGGVEKMVMNLVREFATRLESLDLLVIRGAGPHLDNIPSNVNLIKLQAKHTLTAIPELSRYMKDNRPDAILVAKDRAGRAVIRARTLSGTSPRVVIRLGTNLSTALQQKNKFQAWLRTSPMKRIYQKAEAVVAVSEGVRQDTIDITHIPAERVSVIRNPVITEQFYTRTEGPAPHEWLRDDTIPTFIGVGRLTTQKGFDTLISAFAEVRAQLPVRLLIIGEGGLRESLQQQIDEAELTNDVQMPGFQKNVLDWVAHADCFVLSSRWEGSPNALTEALALGVSCASTRCPSGPNELLDEGRYGPLVEVDDAPALAKAMLTALQQPLPSATLQAAVDEYRATTSATHYLNLLQGN